MIISYASVIRSQRCADFIMNDRKIIMSVPVIKCKKTPRKKCSFVAKEAKKR